MQQTPRQLALTVGTTPILLAEARPGTRQSWYVRNVSPAAQILYISQGTEGGATASGYGYPIRADSAGGGLPGEFIVSSNGYDFKVFQGPIWIWSSAAGGIVYLVEEFGDV